MKSNKIKGIGFDLDGTLVNSLPGLAAAIRQMLCELTLPEAEDNQVAKWIGNGADILVKRALYWAGYKSDNDVFLRNARTIFDGFYAQEVTKGSQLYPEVIETLSRLTEYGYQMALVTNKPTPFVAPLLEQLAINRYFNCIIGGDDVCIKKPHPAPIYLILGHLGLYTHELLFVGDSRNDIQAGQAANCKTAGFTYGYNYGEPIEDSHPDYVFDQFNQLLTILDL